MGNYGATWEHAGYCGKGNVSDLLGSLRGRAAIVCGNAKGVFEEVEEVQGSRLKVEDPVYFAANDVGMYLPHVDHWMSLHVDNLGAWKPVRWLHPIPGENAKYHSIAQRPFIDYAWEGLTPLFCLSGYFAMQIAYLMGSERIILCGCPGSQVPRFFEAKVQANFGYGGGSTGNDKNIQEQVVKEMKRLPDFKERVRSLSGWTREFFGGV